MSTETGGAKKGGKKKGGAMQTVSSQFRVCVLISRRKLSINNCTSTINCMIKIVYILASTGELG